MICTFTLREDVAKDDVAGIGYEYELHTIPDDTDLYVYFVDVTDGVRRRLRYTKKQVDELFADGRWMKVENKNEKELVQMEQAVKETFANGETVHVSGTVKWGEENVRVSTSGVIEEWKQGAFALVTLENVDGDSGVCIHVKKSDITKA